MITKFSGLIQFENLVIEVYPMEELPFSVKEIYILLRKFLSRNT